MEETRQINNECPVPFVFLSRISYLAQLPLMDYVEAGTSVVSLKSDVCPGQPIADIDFQRGRPRLHQLACSVVVFARSAQLKNGRGGRQYVYAINDSVRWNLNQGV